jgi:hypothetical protein
MDAGDAAKAQVFVHFTVQYPPNGD